MKNYKWQLSLLLNFDKDLSEQQEIPPIIQGFYDNGKLDLTELEKYISIVLNIKQKINGVDRNLLYKMKYCEIEAYEKYNITIEDKELFR